jgi:DNA polymerase-3 subunit gamma/tau
MSYEPLHHKYRPQTFADLVGQATIALTLTQAIESNKIAPAYLFTGPRGTGKTSSARILAKSLNCLASTQPTAKPCGRCEVCLAIASGNALDVMEIDAASNTGVDNIREIIERSRFAPVQCRYKIYAIDECHMLSTAAFNALLKTLEEPPPHVVFILATTDPQRVLPTIISRCQRFNYRRIPLEAIVTHLKSIAEREQIDIVDEAIKLVAQIANGGLRDAESLLDQLSLLPNKITVETVWDLVGAIPERDLLKLLIAIKHDRHEIVIQQCRYLLDRGLEPLILLQNLAGFYLNLLIAKTAPSRPDMVAVTELCWQELCREAQDCSLDWILQGQQQLQAAETQLKDTTQPRLWLEITLLGLLPSTTFYAVTPSEVGIIQSSIAASPVVNPEVKQKQPAILEPIELPQHPTNLEITVTKQEDEKVTEIVTLSRREIPVKPNPPATATTPLNPNLDAVWQQVIACLQPPTTRALLRQHGHLISIEETQATVGISSAKLRGISQGKIPNIEAAFEKICQRKIKVQLEVAARQTDIPVPNSISESEDLDLTNKLDGQEINFNESAQDKRYVEANSGSSFQKNFDRPFSDQPERTTAIYNNNKNEAALTNLITEENSQKGEPENREDLQQAIENLTKNFEGEIVQFAQNFPINNTIDRLEENDDVPF